MSAELGVVPFADERRHLASALEGLATNLSAMLDRRLDCFLPGFGKAEVVKAIMPDRRLIFDAQQCAFALKQDFSIIPYAVVAGVAVFGVDESRLLEGVLGDLERATLLAKRLTAALRVRMTGDA
ncbi:MAG TPA: hypothetical protein VMV54_06325 [Acidocella sp.]|nr:hypothetical protein [Acidocella sp.]